MESEQIVVCALLGLKARREMKKECELGLTVVVEERPLFDKPEKRKKTRRLTSPEYAIR